MRSRLFSLAVIWIAVLLLAAPAFAQGDRGAITGVITDAAGAVVPNAEVIATQIETNSAFKSITNSTGGYRIPYVPPGNYKVSAALKGFKTAIVSPVVVAVATVVTVDLKLELGATTESVTVSADATRLESSSSDLGYTASSLDYHDWPINSNDDGQRQIGNFIFSALPGTAGDTYMGSINGSPTASHDVYIEGISIGRADVAGSTSEFQPSVDAISEFRLQTGALNASYGGGLTAVANYNAKSGTNALHGTAYEYFINANLNANSFDNNAAGLGKAPFKQNNFGTAVGGPLLIPKVYNGKNKSFWFFNYEASYRRSGYISGYRTVPTDAFKKGDFSVLPQGIFDPASTVQNPDGSYSRTAFPGNIIPTRDISKVSENIITLAPTQEPDLPGYYHNKFAVPGSPWLNLHDFMGKFDEIITDKQKVSFYWGDNTRVRYNGSPSGMLPIPGNASSTFNLQSIYGTMVRGSYDYTITPSLLNHFAVGFNRFDNYHQSFSTGGDWPTKLGLTNVGGTTFPVITFTGTTATGSAMSQIGNNSTGEEPNGSWIFMNDTTWLHGKHAIKFGAEIRKYYYTQAQTWGLSGNFKFSNQTTSDGTDKQTTGYTYASFLLGDVYSSSAPVVYVQHTYTNTWNPAFYVSDDWKVSKRLTLNVGLRWEVAGAQTEAHGVSSSFSPTLANPGADGYPGALAFLSDVHRSSFQQAYYGEISPRFGFAYQINNRLVLRGGYSLMYEPPIANAFGEALTAGFSNSNSIQQKGIFPALNWDNGYPAYPFTLPDKDPAQLNGNGISYVPANSTRQPYAQNFTFGLQYLLGDKTILQANYVATRGSRLNSGGYQNMNQLNPKYLSVYGDALAGALSDLPKTCPTCPAVPLPYPSFDPSQSVAQALLPYPQFAGGGVSNIYAYVGKSSYNALQVTATRRLAKGLGFLISYSFQKTLSNTDGANYYYGGSVQDVYNRKLDKSVAGFDHTQCLRLTWIYELPLGKGQRWINKGGVVNAILGGWSLTGNQQYQSGDPLSISAGVDTSSYLFQNGFGTIRGDVVSGVPLTVPHSGKPDVASGTGVQYLNPKAFTSPPMTASGSTILQLGNSPRFFGNLRGPYQPSENFGIFKRFHFGEARFFELRMDAFNAFNRSGMGNPDTTIGSPTFGQITDVASGPRQLQLAGRVTF